MDPKPTLSNPTPDRITDMEKRIDSLSHRVRQLTVGISISLGMGIINILLKLFLPFGLAPHPAPPITAPSQNTQTVTLGQTTLPTPTSARTFLTTEEVARRENISPRTLLTYIAENRLTPAPTKTDRNWQISPTYQIIP